MKVKEWAPRASHKRRRLWVADFETLVARDRTWVWAWAICACDNAHVPEGERYKIYTGGPLWSAIAAMHDLGGIFLFHNLAFDGNFIIDYLLNNGWKHTTNRQPFPHSFITLISDMGKFYSIKMNFGDKCIEIRDSLKLLPFSVATIAKTFDLPEQKGVIDYEKYRGEDYVMTPEELEYVKGDVIIVARAVDIMLERGQNKMTIASNALSDYKHTIGPKRFKQLFPMLEIEADSIIR